LGAGGPDSFAIGAAKPWEVAGERDRRDDGGMSDKRRIAEDELYAHFVTFSCHGRRRLLDADHPKRIVLGQLNDQLQRQSAKCIGFVIMPDHVHAIIWFPQTGQLSRFMQQWKRLSSFQIREWYRQNDAHYFREYNMEEKFWTPKYYAFALYSRPKIEEKLAYMHMNPVTAGLVTKAIEWRWSSARWYLESRRVGVPISWVEC
jgi:putative transposase